MSDFDDHPLTTNQFDDHETGNMSDKLRDAEIVWGDAWLAWDTDPTCSDEKAIAVIEADREAVRAATVAEIVTWLRSGNAMKADMASAWVIPAIANAIEAKEWK